MQIILACLLFAQLFIVTSHDMLEIPGWTNSRQVRAVVGTRKLWFATLINSIFPGAAVALALLFWSKPAPTWAKDYWLLYCAVAMLSAIAMWYVPYFLGSNEKTKAEYSQMYSGTWQILPPRGDNPRPNLLHVCIHFLFLATLGLAILVRLDNGH